MTTDQAIQVVLRRILVLNLAVAFAKLGIGFATGAISIIADGFHSLIDGLSNVVAMVAQWIAAQPPDSEHPYGHRRYEAIATFIIGGFLLLTAWEVLQAGVERLMTGGAPQVLPLSFGVMVGTLLVNIGVVAYERAQGKKLESRVLLADSEHTLTDVLVSISVIFSLILVQMGFVQADALAALGIVGVIVRMGWLIISQSIDVLVDTAPLSSEELSDLILAVPQVDAILQIRSRTAGNDIYVDMMVEVAREMTADHAQNLRRAIQKAIQSHFPQVLEVQVSFAPPAYKASNYALRARAAADGLGLGVHEVIAIPSDGGMSLEMHVEVDQGLSLTSAHQQVSQLEALLLAEDDIRAVLTHIEPHHAHGAPIVQTQAALDLRDQAMKIAQTLYPSAGWHDGTIRLALGGYALTMHCHLAGSVSVEEAHSIAEEVETRIRADLPPIQRVTIHTEPV